MRRTTWWSAWIVRGVKGIMHTVAVGYNGSVYTTYNLGGYGETLFSNPSVYASNYIWILFGVIE